MKQKTIKQCCTFEGKGLHTGKFAKMTLSPAPVNTGIVFKRTDISDSVPVSMDARNVSSTSRSTTISKDGASVSTVEHLLSALTGMDIDNVIVEINNDEVPILDGSARPYVKAILEGGIVEQDAERKYLEITETIEIKDENTGSFVRIEPSDKTEYSITVDFNSRVLGEQKVKWSFDQSYAEEIAPCRTFVFFHEIEYLFQHNLIKGGDVDNALVIVEHPVSKEQLNAISDLFGQPRLTVNKNGYLDNVVLRFPNECGRHKMLDLIGDLRLCGSFIKAKVTAYKPGHKINTNAAKKMIAVTTENN